MKGNGMEMDVSDDKGGRPSEALTTEEAAQRVGVSTRTMRRLVSEREIRFMRIGRLVRLQAGDIDAFMAGCVVEPIK
jgi:excisionase family DNA binding protein